MAEKPILFSEGMVRAILDGRKTQTRRVAFPARDLCEFRSLKYPTGWWYRGNVFRDFESVFRHPDVPKCKYRPGDVLWVRETWGDYREFTEDGESGFFYLYKADYPDGARTVPLPETEKTDYAESWALPRWRPSIHMPREAARIFLRVKGVRAERLQAIQTMDAVAEGADARWYQDEWGNPIYENTPIDVFSELWDSTIKKSDLPLYGWDANPWVWVIEFERKEEEKT